MKEKVLVILGLLLAGVATAAYSADLGTFGATYPIVEQDVMDRIQDYIAKQDWARKQEELRKKARNHIENYQPQGLKSLPVVTKDDSYSVDMTWTLPVDISDGKGGIIYPKGFTFNPLEHVYYTRTLVFIDASDKRQVDWLAASPFLKKVDARILLTGGSYYEFMKKYKRHVFYANRRIIDRLGIRAVPAVAVQQGTKMVVHEYAPNRAGQTKKGAKS